MMLTNDAGKDADDAIATNKLNLLKLNSFQDYNHPD